MRLDVRLREDNHLPHATRSGLVRRSGCADEARTRVGEPREWLAHSRGVSTLFDRHLDLGRFRRFGFLRKADLHGQDSLVVLGGDGVGCDTLRYGDSSLELPEPSLSHIAIVFGDLRLLGLLTP